MMMSVICEVPAVALLEVEELETSGKKTAVFSQKQRVRARNLLSAR